MHFESGQPVVRSAIHQEVTRMRKSSSHFQGLETEFRLLVTPPKGGPYKGAEDQRPDL